MELMGNSILTHSPLLPPPFTRRVYLSKKKVTQDFYAIKILRKEDMVRKNMVNHVLAERKVLSLANNPYVVKLFYAFQSKLFLYLVSAILMADVDCR